MSENLNNNNAFYSCNSCLYKTKCPDLINDHVEKRCIRKTYHQPFKCTKSKLEAYSCNRCFFETDLKTGLKRHSQTLHQNIPMDIHLSSHNCRICNFQTFSLLLFLRHINHHDTMNTKKNHHTMNIKNNHDTMNTKKNHNTMNTKKNHDIMYTKKNKMNKNTSCKQNYKKNYQFACEKCSYRAKTMGLLKQHQFMKHTSPDEIQWFECEHCAYKAKTAGSLKTHTIAKHTPKDEIKWFECEQCPYKAKQLGVLKTHVLCKHTAAKDIKWFKCQMCFFETKQAGILKTHVLVRHKLADEVKWFECAHCPYKAKQKSYLANHIQRNHNGDNKRKRSFYKVERKTELILKLLKIN